MPGSGVWVRCLGQVSGSGVWVGCPGQVSGSGVRAGCSEKCSFLVSCRKKGAVCALIGKKLQSEKRSAKILSPEKLLSEKKLQRRVLQTMVEQSFKLV